MMGSAFVSAGAAVVSSALASAFVVSGAGAAVVYAAVVGAAVVGVLPPPQPARDAAISAAIITGNAFFIMSSSFYLFE